MTEMIESMDSLTTQQQELAAELVSKAREEGVELTGPNGLLSGLTKQVLETALETALETELAEHVGYDKPVLVVDEAHLLAHEHLDALRMLTNHDLDSGSPFACLLLGQPTLRRKMKLGVLTALDQRISVRYHMPGMSATDTGNYLRHHLTLAGRSDTLFSDDAISLIHQTSRGVPRAVNNLAIAALLAAYTDNKTIVDETSTRAAVTEVTTD